MDRVAQNAEQVSIMARCAGIAIVAEQFGAWGRKKTREVLAERAGELGFQENEISAAVDEALTAAGTTP